MRMIVMMVCFFAAAVNAESFYLHEKGTGKAYGPFEFKNNGIVKIDDKNYTIISAPENKSPSPVSVKTKLKKIKIPKISLRKATIVDLANLIMAQSKEYDDEQDESRSGVQIIVKLDEEKQKKIFSLNLGPMTVGDILSLGCKMVKARYKIYGETVMIVEENDDSGSFLNRSYVLPAHVVTEIKKAGEQKYIEEMGIKFPEGASAKYDSSLSRLVVRNTPDNIRKLDKIIVQLGGYSSE
jgi:hypothetical protein